MDRENPRSYTHIPSNILMDFLLEAGAKFKKVCHGDAKQAGWWTDLSTMEPITPNVGEKLMLIVSEVSEAMEAHRKNLNDDKLQNRPGIEVELADAVIRIFDLAGGLNLDIEGAIVEKLEYNLHRADHKIENRKNGGKAY